MKRKILSAFLVLTLVFSLVGCSTDELGFYNMLKQIWGLDEFTFEGSLSLKLDDLQIPEEILQNPDFQDIIGETTKIDTTISYDGSVSIEDKTVTLNVTIENAEGKTDPYKFKAVDKSIYLPKKLFDDFFAFTDMQYNTDETGEFVVFTFEEIAQLLNLSQVSPELDALLKKADVAYLIKIIRSLNNKTYDEFINNFFDSLNLDIVSRDNNKYTISMDKDKMIDTLETVFIYLIDNSEKFVTVLKNIFNSLSDDELTLLGIDSDIKQEFLNELEDFDSYYPIGTKEEIIDSFNFLRQELTDIDFSYEKNLEKVDSFTFDSKSKFSLNMNLDISDLFETELQSPYIVVDFDLISELSITEVSDTSEPPDNSKLPDTSGQESQAVSKDPNPDTGANDYSPLIIIFTLSLTAVLLLLNRKAFNK